MTNGVNVLVEGDLKLELPPGVKGERFVNNLSHCMKDVDFIVEEPERTLFIEFKDPEHPRAAPKDRKRFLEELKIGQKDDDLVRKFRDAFIYWWARGRICKPIIYCVLIAAGELEESLLLARTEHLKRKLPVEGCAPPEWKRQIAVDCKVLNIATWKEHFPGYKVKRISAI